MSVAAEAAEPAARVLDKKHLCEALEWSRMKLDRRLETDADFPIKVKGGPGEPWQFDLDAVLEYLQPEGDGFLPVDEEEPAAQSKVGHSGEATARQRRDAAQAMLLEDKIRRSRGDLVEAGPLKLALAETVQRMSTGLNSMADTLVRRLNLPESALPVIRSELDGIRRQLVVGLRDVLSDG